MKALYCLILGPAVAYLVMAAVGSIAVALLAAGAVCYLSITSDLR
jgi:hypothetical protein